MGWLALGAAGIAKAVLPVTIKGREPCWLCPCPLDPSLLPGGICAHDGRKRRLCCACGLLGGGERGPEVKVRCELPGLALLNLLVNPIQP